MSVDVLTQVLDFTVSRHGRPTDWTGQDIPYNNCIISLAGTVFRLSLRLDNLVQVCVPVHAIKEFKDSMLHAATVMDTMVSKLQASPGTPHLRCVALMLCQKLTDKAAQVHEDVLRRSADLPPEVRRVLDPIYAHNTHHASMQQLPSGGFYLGCLLDWARVAKRFQFRLFPGCSYLFCNSLSSNSDSSMPTLACSQCGVHKARYCSRNCQVLDWKKGHHIRVCDRIK